MNIKWNDSEKEYIRLNCQKYHDAEIAKKLTKITGRKISVTSVRKQRRKMGVHKQAGRGICKIV